MQSIQEQFRQRVDADPDRRCLAIYSRDGSFEWASAGEVLEGGTRSAAALSELGLAPGDVCVLVLHNDRFGVSALLGALLCGAIPLLAAPPLIQGAHSSLGDILHDVIRRSGARAVVATETMADLANEVRDKHPGTIVVVGVADLAHMPADAIRQVRPAADDIVAMQLTSGTTGFPRICVWKQRSLLAAIEGMADAMAVGPNDVYLNWTPLYHDMGLVNNFFLCLARGIPLVMMSPFDFVKRPALWLRALSETGANTTWSPNFGFALATKRVSAEQIDGVSLDHVAGFWNAAERIHNETMRDFLQRFAPYGVRPEALRTNFGCAENIGGATFSDPNGGFVVERVDSRALRDEQIARVIEGVAPDDASVVPIVSAGKPHPGIHVHILDEDGEPLPDGHVGEVALHTASRMEGYLGDDESTRAAFQGELLKTGDLGYTRGDEFFWTGRAAERINLRGQKLDPSEFEPVLLSVDGLREGCFAAFGVDDPLLGTQRVVVVSEVREAAALVSDDLALAVKEAIQARLGLSVEVVLVRSGTLAKTSSGKRRHTYFRRMYERDGLQAFRVGRGSIESG